MCAAGLPERTAGVGVASARKEGGSENVSLVVSQPEENKDDYLARLGGNNQIFMLLTR